MQCVFQTHGRKFQLRSLQMKSPSMDRAPEWRDRTEIGETGMNHFFSYNELTVDSKSRKDLNRLCERYMNHCFSLLGSGFVKVSYGLKAKGLHGCQYNSKTMAYFGKKAGFKLRGKCLKTYEPINWFADYKSGFFFSPWYYSSRERCLGVIGRKKGVDIKCPWELGRFYHLPQMAVLAAVDRGKRELLIKEFQNEVIDFIVMNPAGSTVQWACPMDVAIRNVNLLVAFDIFGQIDDRRSFDNAFQRSFERLIRDSLQYILDHLEYSSKGAGSNHYLSNIVGIIFAAAYLPSDEWTDACLVFGVQELISQVGYQFYEEGSNFEGSTSYHRLAAEFVIYATALIYGVLETDRKRVFEKYNHSLIKLLKGVKCQKYLTESIDFFPRWYLDRIQNMGRFTQTILKQNNEIVQIGDNDSGRLLKLTHMGDGLEELELDHRTLLSAWVGLADAEEREQIMKEVPLECSLVEALAKHKRIKGAYWPLQIPAAEKVETDLYEYCSESVVYSECQKQTGLKDSLQICCFSGFGIVVLKSKRLFLSMVIDTAQNALHTGHTHNDKLSVEIMVDGQYITRDPGGYLYSPFPKIRDRFRSVKVHNTIQICGEEQNVFDGMFNMKKRTHAKLVYCDKDKLIARLRYGNVECVREIILSDNKIIVKDYANRPFTVTFQNQYWSVGYGKLRRNADTKVF